MSPAHDKDRPSVTAGKPLANARGSVGPRGVSEWSPAHAAAATRSERTTVRVSKAYSPKNAAEYMRSASSVFLKKGIAATKQAARPAKLCGYMACTGLTQTAKFVSRKNCTLPIAAAAPIQAGFSVRRSLPPIHTLIRKLA